ncbi:MAG: hypothetical protein Q8N85_02940 [Candidatus Omnitrophota bacterium]|nr:hypothetical protein [Candidatus Omnitrophota bacterium]
MALQEVKLGFKSKRAVLALGTQNKNRLCFLKGNIAFLSAMRADLSDPKDYAGFEKSARYFLRQRPKIIAYDLHPGYMSTKFALDPRHKTHDTRPIQHHHSHIASCMAENGLKNQKVIGVAFDGTGLGIDNTLWGAEFLVADYKNFRRRAHLKEIPLLGGERAIIEPWRVAAAWLDAAFKGRFLRLRVDLVKKIKAADWQALKKISRFGFNSPLASSMGRLFDAVASLITGRLKVDSEAVLARELEKLASGYAPSFLRPPLYSFKLTETAGGYILDPSPLFRKIIVDLQGKESLALIAYKFHLAVAKMIKDTCLLLRKKDKINQVVLSGGVFQNKLLLKLTLDLLRKEKFRVFRHEKLSCGDSSLALGQAVIAGFTKG